MRLDDHPDREAVRALAQSHGWLADRAPEARDAILSIAQVRDYQPDQVVFRAGVPARGVYGLVSGAVDILIPRPDGQELAAHRAERGFWAGDLSLLSGQANLVTIRSAVRSRILLLPGPDLLALLARRPELNRDFFELSHANLAVTLWTLASIAIQDSETRIVLRLLQLDSDHSDPEGWLKISQEKLSQLVALSPATLQRCLRTLRGEGLIELAYGRMRVLDRTGMETRFSERSDN
ncbi:MAG: Crp/Fnr family transcriptional regulator [Gammaproteobacteria bacterium]